MGRRKIEIKAIKDDRNRSVTCLKRKGGLFKKAHELSVLCSVDVAVFIFGNNKKLYKYSSSDMQDLIHRYQLHGPVNEHKGPADFNGGHDDEEDEDADASPSRRNEAVEAQTQMMPPQFHGQQPPFSQILRHHTASASPPIANGVPYHHPGQHPRGVTPQPPIGSRPSSRNDARRLPPTMITQPGASQGAHPNVAYMPAPPIYSSSTTQQSMLSQHSGAYSYPPPQQTYSEERRPSAPPSYPTQHPPPPPPAAPSHAAAAASRPEPSPPLSVTQHPPPHPVHYVSPPSPQVPPDRQLQDLAPPPPIDSQTERPDRSHLPFLSTDTAVKKMPQRKSHSIFTPIEENRSILSQHLAHFATEAHAAKSELGATGAAPPLSRSQSVDASAVDLRDGAAASSELRRSNTQGSLDRERKPSTSSGPDTAYTPPSRSDSLKAGSVPAGGARPRGPRLTVQIPDGESEPGSATGESHSPPNPAVTPTNAPQRHNSHSSVVLPAPSPSASALLSAGASGPPNPFARPPPQQSVNETPASALPSRFLGNELLPSPSSFYADWNFRGNDSHTLPSPLNFATPLVGSGPSFLREDNHAPTNAGSNSGSSGLSSGATGLVVGNGGHFAAPGSPKRKSSDYTAGSLGDKHGTSTEPKRIKAEYA